MIRDANTIERELRIAKADLMKLSLNAHARKPLEKRIKLLAAELALTGNTSQRLARLADLLIANMQLRAERDALLAALQMVCDSGVALADPIERAMLAAIAKVQS
jgi:hypothetical protein